MPFFAFTNPAIDPKLGTLALSGVGQALTNVFTGLITLALIIGGIIFLFMLILGGYQYLTAGGDKEALSQAGKRLTSALIGLTILLSLMVIMRLTSAFFGVNLLAFNLPSFSTPPP